MSTVGPELPPHLLAKRKRQAEDEEEDSLQRDRPSQRPSRSPSSESGEKRRRVVGPSLPPANLKERPSDGADKDDSSSSDDDFGPALPDGQGSQIDGEAEASQRKALAEESAAREAAKKPQRDDWMIVPPKQDDWSSRVDPTKLRNRKFNTGKGSKAPPPKGGGENTVWTETPDQKRQRLEDEVMGVRKPAALGPEDQKSSITEAEGVETARRIQEYNVRLSGRCALVAWIYDGLLLIVGAYRRGIGTRHFMMNTKRLCRKRKKTIRAKGPLIRRKILEEA